MMWLLHRGEMRAENCWFAKERRSRRNLCIFGPHSPQNVGSAELVKERGGEQDRLMTREAGLVAIRTGALTPVAYGKAIGGVLRAKDSKEG